MADIDASTSQSRDRVADMAAALEAPLSLGGGWSLLRLFCLRSAGFSIDGLATLSAPALRAAWLAVEIARGQVTRELDATRRLCTAKLQLDRGAASRPWRRALNRLDRRRPPTTLEFDADGQRHSARLADALRGLAAAEARMHAAFASEDIAVTERMRPLIREPEFCAAVAWQNRELLARALRPLIDGAAPVKPHTLRARRKAAALYLQRYRAKNEHIGFFGPAAWATIGRPPTRGAAGRDVIACLDSFYEWWAIEALARRFESDAQFRLALTPRLSPSARLTEAGLQLPDGVLRLDAAQARFIAELDGTRSGAAVSKRLMSEGVGDLASPAAYQALLEQLADADIITWGIVLPIDVHPERDLARALDALPPATGASARAALARLNAARDRVTAAAMHEVESALAAFDQVFEQETAARARRLEGADYAGRTPLYSDGLRAFDFTLGEDIVAALAPSLRLVLDSARWFCARMVEQYLDFVTAEARVQCARFRGDVPLSALWSLLSAQTDTALAIADDVVDDLQERWLRCLGHSDGARERRCEPAALADAVAREFASGRAPWAGARLQSPDLMLAADSIDAIARGEWLAVLGELHVMTNLMAQRLSTKQCPVEDALLAATARVQSLPELIPATSRTAKGTRTAYSVHLAHDIHIEYERNCSWKQGAQVVRMADLVVRQVGGEWQVRSLADARSWPLLQFIGPQLRSIAIARFKPLRLDRHLPRITIGRLVLQREAWRHGAGALDFVRIKDRAARYLALRHWAARQHLPRHLFYRLEGELKPLYLDLDSLVYTDLFADGVRALAPDASVSLSEMLPSPAQCWLRDAAGRRYTAEFRMGAYTSGDDG